MNNYMAVADRIITVEFCLMHYISMFHQTHSYSIMLSQFAVCFYLIPFWCWDAEISSYPTFVPQIVQVTTRIYIDVTKRRWSMQWLERGRYIELEDQGLASRAQIIMEFAPSVFLFLIKKNKLIFATKWFYSKPGTSHDLKTRFGFSSYFETFTLPTYLQVG